MNKALGDALKDTSLINKKENNPFQAFADKAYELLADPTNEKSVYSSSKAAFAQFHTDVVNSKKDFNEAVKYLNTWYEDSYPAWKAAKDDA